MNEGILISVKPLTSEHDAYLLLDSGVLQRFDLTKGQSLSIEIAEQQTKYCVGWYDIEKHENHLCEQKSVVQERFDSCFVCREKTGFNPGFYNTSDISEKQEAYNLTPHTVYIAYFGHGIAKAGIMADSRNIDRLYEQGALWYSLVRHCPNATEAHNLESKLIKKGLKNSVTKNQKATVLKKPIDKDLEASSFQSVLDSVGYSELERRSLVDHFFFGSYQMRPVEAWAETSISGHTRGIVGRYLILENNDVFYGVWLSDLYGRKIKLGDSIALLDHAPVQASLFRL